MAEIDGSPDGNTAASFRRPKLTIRGQVSHLRGRGVRFGLVTEAEAGRYLRDDAYFFRVKAYENDFQRDAAGRYLHLDFAYLMDLDGLDEALRSFVLRVFPVLERRLKVDLNRRLCEAGGEDGYGVVSDFLSSPYNRHPRLVEELKARHIGPDPAAPRDRYVGRMLGKYLEDPAYWSFMEVLTFGDLRNFHAFCLDRLGARMRTERLLFAAGRIRNAAAHGNCLLDDVYGKTDPAAKGRTLRSLFPSLLGLGLTTSMKRALNVSAVQDMAAMLMVALELGGTPQERDVMSRAALGTARRAGLHVDDYYAANPKLRATLSNLAAILGAFAARLSDDPAA
ncbi:Abi family protein [Bifidobacterium vespertilionis]|uniref:Abi family protein n=1 Tax=Bifidobacterium vespertilionis TaxID=2562524 RepID=A0A5J5DX52_9BIFI|nr:Abi family protein [Bifidobacterium vespertilionis]KAA8821174.1 Abi family protein [Bifidobacterium vespertilionis]KAA8821455.1 Abi family protein [Bifidobacterium vespertilionis]